MMTEIELAKQAGLEYADDDRGFKPLWAFAELVRADEREACAKVCDLAVVNLIKAESTRDQYKVAVRLRDAILARSNT